MNLVETYYFLEVLKISKYMMLLARFIVAPACCNQRPKEPALLHHSEKLHFVLHYFASLNMLTFDLSAGNAWQPLKTLWASPGHYDHSANSMIDIKWVQLTQSITKPTVVFPWVYVDWLVMFNSPMMHETSNAWGFSILQTVHCYTYLLMFSSPTCLPGSEKKAASGRRAKGRDAQNAEVTGCSRLSRQGEQCVCVCDAWSIIPPCLLSHGTYLTIFKSHHVWPVYSGRNVQWCDFTCAWVHASLFYLLLSIVIALEHEECWCWWSRNQIRNRPSLFARCFAARQ